MAEASESGDRVLIMIFSYGDYDFPGGIYLDIDETSNYGNTWLLTPFHMTSVFANSSEVRTTMCDFLFFRSLS